MWRSFRSRFETDSNHSKIQNTFCDVRTPCPAWPLPLRSNHCSRTSGCWWVLLAGSPLNSFGLSVSIHCPHIIIMDADVNHPQQDLEYHIINISEKLEALRNVCDTTYKSKLPIGCEIRSIEFWKSVITECLATFIYVLIVYGAGASVGGGNLAVLSTALASGLAMVFLTECFILISGAHISPAVSLASALSKNISVLRCCSYIVSQCGGAIAGAALNFCGVIDMKKTLIAVTHIEISERVPVRLGMEFLLTFVVVFTYFIYVDGRKKLTGPSSMIIGAAYSACTLVSVPHLNPARSLGACFVLNKWKNHWVFWIGPMTGGAAAGLVFKYIYNREKSAPPSEISEDDSVSIRSEEPTYDNVDKPAVPKHHGSTYNTYRPSNGLTKEASAYCLNTGLYSTAPTKMERVESLYGGTKSLYCKSPQLTRANLNRSQSLYSRNGNNRDVIPKPGPLAPAQSLYSIKLNQQNHVQNQNVQNQLQHRSESVYGVRSAVTRPDPYGTSAEWSGYGRNNPESGNACGDHKSVKNNRPDSMYGILDSTARQYDSNCTSYTGSSQKGNSTCNYSTNNLYATKTIGPNSAFRAVRSNNTETRALPSPNTKLLIPAPANNNPY